MDEDIINSVLVLYRQKDWKGIVEKYHNHPDRNKLLWVYPTEENFQFLSKSLTELKCESILSIGCGSGLLEWMITEATDLPVSGIEVDEAWWQCKYAPPTFIPLLITTPEMDRETISLLNNSERTALLFCYFNNGPAFKKYLEHYSGSTVIIIGPGDGKGVHTDPRPFGDLTDEWILLGSEEVGNSRDFIAIYYKK